MWSANTNFNFYSNYLSKQNNFVICFDLNSFPYLTEITFALTTAFAMLTPFQCHTFEVSFQNVLEVHLLKPTPTVASVAVSQRASYDIPKSRVQQNSARLSLHYTLSICCTCVCVCSFVVVNVFYHIYAH